MMLRPLRESITKTLLSPHLVTFSEGFAGSFAFEVLREY